MEKFLQNLEEANREINSVDHLANVVYPLVKDKKILLKILTETSDAVKKIIVTILQYDYIKKRIQLSKDPKENFKIFIESSAKFHKLETEAKKIVELFSLIDKHKQSTMEFVRGDKIVIVTENMNTTVLTLEKVKEFIILAKSLMKKLREDFENQNI